MKETLKNLLRPLKTSVTDWADANTKTERALSICVSEFVHHWGHLSDANDPMFIVNYVRAALAPMECDITQASVPQEPHDQHQAKFQYLLQTLENMPPLPGSVIQEQIELGDAYLGNHASHGIGDVAWHFRMSSSLGVKARILYTIARSMRSNSFIEIGTAYGMSGILLMRAAMRTSGEGRLWTVERDEQQYELASEQLQTRFPSQVSCRLGLSNDMMASIVAEAKSVDLFFHDGGHSKEHYINDFNAVIDTLSAGSIAVIDDINWYDKRFCESDPECYAGWEYIASHPRVEWAVEVNSSIGVALIR